MTTKKKATTGVKKLKLKRETIKNLDVKNKAKDIKGGMPPRKVGTGSCNMSCEQYC